MDQTFNVHLQAWQGSKQATFSEMHNWTETIQRVVLPCSKPHRQFPVSDTHILWESWIETTPAVRVKIRYKHKVSVSSDYCIGMLRLRDTGESGTKINNAIDKQGEWDRKRMKHTWCSLDLCMYHAWICWNMHVSCTEFPAGHAVNASRGGNSHRRCSHSCDWGQEVVKGSRAVFGVGQAVKDNYQTW